MAFPFVCLPRVVLKICGIYRAPTVARADPGIRRHTKTTSSYYPYACDMPLLRSLNLSIVSESPALGRMLTIMYVFTSNDDDDRQPRPHRGLVFVLSSCFDEYRNSNRTTNFWKVKRIGNIRAINGEIVNSIETEGFSTHETESMRSWASELSISLRVKFILTQTINLPFGKQTRKIQTEFCQKGFIYAWTAADKRERNRWSNFQALGAGSIAYFGIFEPVRRIIGMYIVVIVQRWMHMTEWHTVDSEQTFACCTDKDYGTSDANVITERIDA